MLTSPKVRSVERRVRACALKSFYHGSRDGIVLPGKSSSLWIVEVSEALPPEGCQKLLDLGPQSPVAGCIEIGFVSFLSSCRAPKVVLLLRGELSFDGSTLSC
jgi:hypothetical protein